MTHVPPSPHSTEAIISDSITSTGPGTGPWLGGEVGTLLPSCLLGSGFNTGCAITWSDQQGWSLQWDPGNFGEGILDSSNHFWGMGIFGTSAESYSVTLSSVAAPEPGVFALLLLPLGLVLRRRNYAEIQKNP